MSNAFKLLRELTSHVVRVQILWQNVEEILPDWDYVVDGDKQVVIATPRGL